MVLHSQDYQRNTTRVPWDGGAECLLLESSAGAVNVLVSLAMLGLPMEKN